MARKLSEYRESLAKAIAELNATRQRDALDVVREGLALTKLRVINTGVNAEGNGFKPYSRRVLPWFFFGSSYGKDGIRSLDFDREKKVEGLKKKFPKGASYFDWRQFTGRVSPFKNFSFSNQMWASIRANIIKVTARSVTLEVVSSIKKFTEVIIPAHNRREGINILQTTDQERKIIYEAFRQRRLAILKKYNILK